MVKHFGAYAARFASRVIQDEPVLEVCQRCSAVKRAHTHRAGRLRVVVTVDSSFSGDLHSVRTSPSAHIAKTGVSDMSACSAA